MNSLHFTHYAVCAAGLYLSGCGKPKDATTTPPNTDASAQVKCMGINECRGQSACNTATTSCAGENTCAGKGWLKVTEAVCAEKGGKVIA